VIVRADQLPPSGSKTRSFGPVAVADTKEAAIEYELWGATKLTVNVVGAPVYVQLSRSTPPQPAEWDDPIPLPTGVWGHSGLFGYWRFWNQVPGTAGNVSGSAYRE
jgi:hypothetical protein